MQNYTTCGISFSKDILTKMDAERGLIPRSIFLRKILEQTYSDNEVNENAISQILPKVEPPRESVIPSTKRIGDPKPVGW
jgi:hypothetical protein